MIKNKIENYDKKMKDKSKSKNINNSLRNTSTCTKKLSAETLSSSDK
jgi:hypothetical protein